MSEEEEVVSSRAAILFSEIWPLVVKYKKTCVILFLFELWIHSLVFQHLHELKTLKDVFPIIGAFFGL